MQKSIFALAIIESYSEYNMARKQAIQGAVQPSKGTKRTFDDDDEDEHLGQSSTLPAVQAGSSRARAPSPSSSVEDGSDDDLPETVGLSAGKRVEEEEAKRVYACVHQAL
jgi:hypothetical protein